MSQPKFKMGPRKPATEAQAQARELNWGLFAVTSAISSLPKTIHWLRYKATGKDEEEIRLLELAERDLASAFSYLEETRRSLYAINKLKRERNQGGKKS